MEERIHGTISVAEPRLGFTGVGSAFAIVGPSVAPHHGMLLAERIEISWPGWTEAIAHALNDTPLGGDTDDGRYAIAEPACLLSLEGQGDSRKARFALRRLRLYAYRPPGSGRPTWMYHVLNFRLGSSVRTGDLLVQEYSNDRGSSWYRDTIRFGAYGREWLLRDALDANDNKTLRNFDEHSEPISSAVLWTAVRSGDDPEQLDLHVASLCNMLSFATARAVRWHRRLQLDAGCNIVGSMAPSLWCEAPHLGGGGPIDTHSTGSLAIFLQAGTAVSEQDIDWWNRTLELHLQGMLSPIIDVRLTFFYILLDRTSRRIIGDKFPAQIDPKLDDALDSRSWRAALDALLGGLSPQWSAERTGALIGTIKGWNSEPSYARRVQLAAETVGLPVPDANLIRPRSRLLHDGDPKAHSTGGSLDISQVSARVEALTTALLLRALGHSGNAYLPEAGRGCEPIHPWPTGRPIPWVL